MRLMLVWEQVCTFFQISHPIRSDVVGILTQVRKGVERERERDNQDMHDQINGHREIKRDNIDTYSVTKGQKQRLIFQLLF